MDVRLAEPKDLATIVELSRDFEKDNPHLETQVNDTLQSYIVAGDPAVGFLRANPLDDKLLVTQVVVSPEHQRSGVGTALLDGALDIAKVMGLTGVVNCGPKTPAITKLYEKLGYEEIDRFPDAWGKGQDAIVLFKGVEND